jgi:hypothetical protein
VALEGTRSAGCARSPRFALASGFGGKRMVGAAVSEAQLLQALTSRPRSPIYGLLFLWSGSKLLISSGLVFCRFVFITNLFTASSSSPYSAVFLRHGVGGYSVHGGGQHWRRRDAELAGDRVRPRSRARGRWRCTRRHSNDSGLPPMKATLESMHL